MTESAREGGKEEGRERERQKVCVLRAGGGRGRERERVCVSER